MEEWIKKNLYLFYNSHGAVIGKCDAIEVAEKKFYNDDIIKVIKKDNKIIFKRI